MPLSKLFLYCYEIDSMDSVTHDNQADVTCIGVFNLTSRYLDDLSYFLKDGQSNFST